MHVRREVSRVNLPISSDFLPFASVPKENRVAGYYSCTIDGVHYESEAVAVERVCLGLEELDSCRSGEDVTTTTLYPWVLVRAGRLRDVSFSRGKVWCAQLTSVGN